MIYRKHAVRRVFLYPILLEALKKATPKVAPMFISKTISSKRCFILNYYSASAAFFVFLAGFSAGLASAFKASRARARVAFFLEAVLI